MKLLMAAMTALSLSVGGFVATSYSSADAAAPKGKVDYSCRAASRIFNCGIVRKPDWATQASGLTPG